MICFTGWVSSRAECGASKHRLVGLPERVPGDPTCGEGHRVGPHGALTSAQLAFLCRTLLSLSFTWCPLLFSGAEPVSSSSGTSSGFLRFS